MFKTWKNNQGRRDRTRAKSAKKDACAFFSENAEKENRGSQSRNYSRSSGRLPRQDKTGARKTGLSHEELGKKINEKASVLSKLETGKMTPNNVLVTKLEHALKIKLLVPIKEEKFSEIPKSPNRETTLGDLIQLNKKGGEEPTERKQS